MFALIGAVLGTALILPLAASAWFRNLANARIARAMTLPVTSPNRSAALNEADEFLAQARALSGNALVEFSQARSLVARPDNAGALKAMGATDDSLQRDVIAQFVWGQTAFASGNQTEAFAHWRDADALGYFENQSMRAGFNHQWQVAESWARIAVGIAPERAETHYYLGDALGYLSPANSEALSELERAAALERGDPEFLSTILSRQGELLAAQGKDRDALALFARAQTVAPRDARPRIGYAVMLFRVDPSAEAEAVAILTQVVADSPWTISAHLQLARLAEAHHDFTGAENWYRAALARNPNNPDALFAFGQFYARQNQVDQAKRMLTLAAKYETHVDDQQTIARALAELDSK